METLAYSCAGCLISCTSVAVPNAILFCVHATQAACTLAFRRGLPKRNCTIGWHVTKRCCKKQPAHRNCPNICLIGFGYTVKSHRLLYRPTSRTLPYTKAACTYPTHNANRCNNGYGNKPSEFCCPNWHNTPRNTVCVQLRSN